MNLTLKLTGIWKYYYFIIKTSGKNYKELNAIFWAAGTRILLGPVGYL